MAHNVRDYLDSGFRRAKIEPQVITGEMMEFARQTLYDLLCSCANYIPLLWRVDTKPYGLYPNQRMLVLEDNTVDVLYATHRTINKYTAGTITSSAGGSPSSAFNTSDEDYFQQTSSNGSLMYDAGSGSTIKVETVGLMSYGDNEYLLDFQISDDGSNWRSVLMPSPNFGETHVSYPDRVWKWADISSQVQARYFRILETSGGVLSFRHVVFGYSMSELPMAALNRDQYFSLPNKNAPGRPLQYWKDRQENHPVLHLWHVPDDAQKFYQIMITRHAHVVEPTFEANLNIPMRWSNAVKCMLAEQLSMEYASLIPDPNWPMMLMTQSQAALRLVLPEERDNSPSTFRANIRGYTRK